MSQTSEQAAWVKAARVWFHDLTGHQYSDKEVTADCLDLYRQDPTIAPMDAAHLLARSYLELDGGR